MFTPNKNLFDACSSGDFELVKKLLSLGANIHENNDACLLVSIKNQHYNIAEYLLTSPELKEHADIHANDDEALYLSIENKNYDFAKFLLCSKQLKIHCDVNASNNHALIFAIQDNNLEFIRFLLTSPELSKNANIHNRDRYDNAIMRAIRSKNLELVKYFLLSPELKEWSDLEAIIYCVPIRETLNDKHEVSDWIRENRYKIESMRATIIKNNLSSKINNEKDYYLKVL